MQQESVVRLAFGGKAITVAGIGFLMLRVPALGIRRIGNHGVQIQGIILLRHIIIHGPVLLQCITAAGKDIVRLNAPHYKVHSCQIIGVFFQFLSVIHDVIFALCVLGNALTDGNEQRTRTAGGIVNFNFLSIFQMVGNNFGHELRYFVRCIELTGLFARIGCKVADQVLINKAQNIIVLFAISRDILNQLNQIPDCLCLAAGAVAQFA